MTAPNTPTRTMSAQLAEMLTRIEALERGSKSSQLGNSSLDGSSLSVVAPDGTRLASWGVQPDGTASTKNTDPKTPPRPNTPIVTPVVAGIEVEWNGLLIQVTPGNFSHVTLHVSPVEGFVASESNQIGTLREAGKYAVATDYVTQYVKLVAWSTSGVASEPSFEQSAEPGKVVADSVRDGIIGELALAEGAVKEAALAAGAVTSTKVGDNAITTPKIVAGAVQASTIAAGAVQTGHLTADAVTVDKLAALSVTSDKMTANAVTAGKIEAGAVKSSHLESTLILGNRIIAGDPTSTRVEMSSSGLLVVRADGDTTFSVDSSSGDVVSMGEYYTSRFGERLAMNSGGLQSPTIRAYPNRGSRYADLRSYTRTLNGTDVANWEFRVPLAPGVAPYQAGLVDFCVYDANFNPREDSRLRYRPFDNGSGVVHPGWAADGQNAAVVFYNGGVYITNSANTARTTLFVATLYSEGQIEGANLISRGRIDTTGGGYIGGALDVMQVLTGHSNQGLTGSIWCQNVNYSGGLVFTSDEATKRNFEPVTGALDAFGDIEWPSWQRLPSPSTEPGGEERRQTMATAQAMQEHPIFAPAVMEQSSTPPEDGSECGPEPDMLGVDLATLTGIQGAALHEANHRIVALEAEVTALREQVAALEPAAKKKTK